MEEIFPGISVREKHQIRGRREIAHRALAVSAMVYRQSLERARFYGDNNDQTMALGLINGVNRWVKDTMTDEHLTTLERDLLSQAPGGWVATDVFDPSFEDRLGILLWALTMIKVLPEADLGFPDNIHLLTGIPDSTSGFMKAIKLRPDDELLKAYDRLGSSIVTARHFLDTLTTKVERLSNLEKRKMSRMQLVRYCSQVRRAALAWVLGTQGEWDEGY